MISPRYAREIPQRYRLEAGRCKECGKLSFPPRLICPKCRGRKFETVRLKEEGTILTFAIIRVAGEKFSKQTPFAVAIVELVDGVRLTTQIADVDLEKIEIGKKVRIVFRKIQEEGKSGILCYGYKAILT